MVCHCGMSDTDRCKILSSIPPSLTFIMDTWDCDTFQVRPVENVNEADDLGSCFGKDEYVLHRFHERYFVFDKKSTYFRYVFSLNDYYYRYSKADDADDFDREKESEEQNMLLEKGEERRTWIRSSDGRLSRTSQRFAPYYKH
eukprot:GHVP01022271.1.p1 GENE.GHVP01022271.1~~GHVP01022271.1.p1  ORF type:complete len:143 (+),score=11.76 GHVP01022271.1:409-837(+)